MRKSVILFCVLLGVAVSSCNGPFYYDDNGKTVTLPKGAPFEINLEESVSADYSWQIQSCDSTIVYPTLRPLTRKHNEREGTQMRTFYFQTVGTGQTTIKLVYSKSGSEDYTKEFKLIVKSES
jgi:predicted secreted protein